MRVFTPHAVTSRLYFLPDIILIFKFASDLANDFADLVAASIQSVLIENQLFNIFNIAAPAYINNLFFNTY